MKLKQISIHLATILFLIFIILNCNEDNSQLIETIGGEKITTNRIKSAFETEIEYFSRMQNLEKKNLIESV